MEENKSSENLIKDTSSSIAQYGNKDFVLIFHTKTNKLITALYMVTDIMRNDEPMRNKLRSLGTDILSDIHNFSYRTDLNLMEKSISKISEVLSFLEIATTVGMISQMNYVILKKEFINLKDSFIKHDNPISIEEFLNQSSSLDSSENLLEKENNFTEQNIKKIQTNSTRIGVQKGSTLMRALKDIKGSKTSKIKMSNRTNFNDLKKERREAIVKIIKNKKEATITDIKTSAIGLLASCGEKTLQRELISMVSDGVLNKIGEKRWSKYSIKY